MRKIKSTALLGAFVAVASVGVISHEAHGATLTPQSTVTPIAKEMLPSSVSLPYLSLSTGDVTYPSNVSVTLTLSGASFVNGYYYAILGNGSYTACSVAASYSGQNSLTLNCNSLTGGTSYTLVGGQATPVANNTSFTVYVPQSSSSIVLSYISSYESASAPIAQVQQQLSFSPISSSIYYISLSSLSTFANNNSNNASNTVVLTNNAFNNTWSNTINVSDTMNFLFTGIPSSVTLVSATDSNNISSSTTPGNASATVSFTLASGSAPFKSASSDTITFGFSNSGNIQPGTIVLSSITGIAPNASASNYVYLSTPQNFLSFSLPGTQIYIPDALAPDNNEITAGYITISMPSSASIASISVLNNPNASCPVPTAANGSFTSTSGVSYIDLSKLAPLCTGLDSKAWGSGVPLVINITGTNATPTNITADAYAVINGFGLKRIPVNVLNIGAGTANFSY